ncbi:MAG: hypothetical protein A2X35_02960 [Elusimicrobia bacterium GWA2_61_42]|nr:MAG: hypothetical protein A2X35_02960 [Elusimicrobia bacterium GWA2_61_42]OGR74799.1 MAG: hypothetical protein A2X38_08535 [Elusimicrobia bacterium GWC2_61_25]
MTDNNDTAARISIREVCGDAPLTGTSGIKIHKLIVSHWAASKSVEVDFAKVRPSPTFLHEAIGRLIGQFPKAEIVAKLRLSGLSALDKKTLNGIVVNQYHALVNAEKLKNRPRIIPKLKE